jgi:signal transduction histidine kinase
MLHSIRARLTAWYTAVMLVVLAAAGMASYGVARRQIVRSTDLAVAIEARQFTAGLNDEATESHGTLHLSSANELLADFRDNDRAVVLFTEDGREFAAHATPLARSLDRAMLRGRIAGHELGFLTSDGIRIYLLAVRVGAQPFVVAVAQSLELQNETLADLREGMLITLPLALVIASVGGYFLARRSLAPIDEAFTAQRRFMADASHELRSPVAILQGELDVSLSRPDRDAADYRESLSVMRRTVSRLTRIVRDLFLLARSDAGEMPVRKEPVDLGDIAGQTVRALRTLAAERQIDLRLECDGDVVVRGDEDLLQRMAANLVENAIKYTVCGSVVLVRCSHAGNSGRLEVLDSGPSIPPALRDRIFERFFRGDASRPAMQMREGSGAGLGLPIARWIAEAHGGTLILGSAGDSPAGGNAFIATLPLVSSNV